MTNPVVRWILVPLLAAFAWLTPVIAQAQVLSINDVAQTETSGGGTTFAFVVSLDAPAPPSGVHFDISTSDGTATAGSDYTAQSLFSEVIPSGGTTYTFSVNVNGDVIGEPTETFFVIVSGVTGATLGDGVGTATILDDDVMLIHDVQGNGAMTPILAAQVTIRGIVTGVRDTGFFVQEEDADADADPQTSEGIFVSTLGTLAGPFPPLAWLHRINTASPISTSAISRAPIRRCRQPTSRPGGAPRHGRPACTSPPSTPQRRRASR